MNIHETSAASDPDAELILRATAAAGLLPGLVLCAIDGVRRARAFNGWLEAGNSIIDTPEGGIPAENGKRIG